MVPLKLDSDTASADTSSAIRNVIQMRRAESFSLHESLQGIHFPVLDCFLPGDFARTGRRPCTSALHKQRELFSEFMYWLIDSYCIPLLKVCTWHYFSLPTENCQTCFYVTDCASTERKIFFFRQDDWSDLTLPLLHTISENRFSRIAEVFNSLRT